MPKKQSKTAMFDPRIKWYCVSAVTFLPVRRIDGLLFSPKPAPQRHRLFSTWMSVSPDCQAFPRLVCGYCTELICYVGLGLHTENNVALFGHFAMRQDGRCLYLTTIDFITWVNTNFVTDTTIAFFIDFYISPTTSYPRGLWQIRPYPQRSAED